MRTWRRGRLATSPTPRSPGRTGTGPGRRARRSWRPSRRRWRTCRPSSAARPRRGRGGGCTPARSRRSPGGRPRLRPARGGRRPVHRGRRRRRPRRVHRAELADDRARLRRAAPPLLPGTRRRLATASTPSACTQAGSRRTRPRPGTRTWWRLVGRRVPRRSRCPAQPRPDGLEAQWLARRPSRSRHRRPARGGRSLALRLAVLVVAAAACALGAWLGAWWVPFLVGLAAGAPGVALGRGRGPAAAAGGAAACCPRWPARSSAGRYRSGRSRLTASPSARPPGRSPPWPACRRTPASPSPSTLLLAALQVLAGAWLARARHPGPASAGRPPASHGRSPGVNIGQALLPGRR